MRQQASPEEIMVQHFMRFAEHRGSDIRVDVQSINRPGTWPRAGMNPNWWCWKTIIRYPFVYEAHITELELRAALSMLHWRLRHQNKQNTTFLHLLDSAVSIAVASKHRSSSRRLMRILVKMDCLELVGSLYPLYAYVRSELNPADEGSRSFELL